MSYSFSPTMSATGIWVRTAAVNCAVRRRRVSTSWPARGCASRDISWDSATYVDTITLTHSINEPLNELLEKGPQIVEAVAGGQLRTVKPYTREVRAEIDIELVAKSIDFMKRQKAIGKPFFLYLPFSMGHFPNLPSKEFAGKSQIGQFGKADGRRSSCRPDPRYAQGTRNRRQYA